MIVIFDFVKSCTKGGNILTELVVQDQEEILPIGMAIPLVDYSTRTVALSEEDLVRRMEASDRKPQDKTRPLRNGAPYPVIRPHLILTNQCNLDCTYCFAQGGSYGQNIASMDERLAQQIVDFSEKNLDQGVTVMFAHFGGEPLLNFEVIKKINELSQPLTEKFDHSKFNQSVITNGTSLTEDIAHFMINHRIGLILSLDGRKQIHDKVRVNRAGRGSFEDAIAGLSYFPSDYPITVRATISHWTNIPKEIVFFRSLGISSIEFGIGGEYPPEVNIPERTLGQINELFEYALEKDDPKCIGEVFPFNMWIGALHSFAFESEYKPLRDCGVGHTRIAVTPDGSILPCPFFYGLDDWSQWTLGDVANGIDTNSQIDFVNFTLNVRRWCASCHHRILCEGPCIGRLPRDQSNPKPDCHSSFTDLNSIKGVIHTALFY
jgi:uncharacterized protein